MIRKVLTSIILILFIFSACSTNKIDLKQQLINYNPNYFHEDDELIYLGTVNQDQIFEIYFNKFIFGNNRMTCRLIIFSKNKVLGSYKVDDLPIIENNIILFPYTETIGNKIQIQNGNIPKKVYLNGETITFDISH